MDSIQRCKWCNMKNPLYIEYHDNEWCVPNFDDKYLYEMLLLESFQAGLSWECVLNKRDAFVKAYDGFDIDKIIAYDDNKVNELLNNKDIIRNKLKIKASINNSKIFKAISSEYGSFYNYLRSFTNDKIIYETDKTTNDLSDELSKDLQKRGMTFVGSTIIYSYLQAIGVIYSHDKDCYLYKSMNDARVIFEQTAFQSFRDPTAYFKGDTCYLYFTLVQNESDGQYFYVAESHSDDLKNWSEIRMLTERSKALNFSSPGNVFYHNGYYYMCLQTYPRENGETYGNKNSRIFLMKSTDLLNWSEPEIVMVKGDIPVSEMGRMIDPYILKDNDKFICFFKQNGVSYSVSKDLENWEFMGSTDCGENVSVIKQNDEYLIFHSPKNGIGLLKSKDLKSFENCGVTTLNQEKYPWAKDRITAGFVIEHNNKTYLFFHGDNEDNYLFGATLAVIEDFCFMTQFRDGRNI